MILMYLQEEIARQRACEALERARRERLAANLAALRRAGRRVDRAERKLCRALMATVALRG